MLFLDEPTVGLDVQAREALWTSIRRLLADGCSIVLTTHYLEEAEALADRVAVITKGRVIAAGSVDDMRALVARRQISCESQLPLDEVRAWPGVVEARTRPQERLHITATDAEDVVRRLLAADPTLRRLEVRQAGLNEAFNELTRGGCMNALALNIQHRRGRATRPARCGAYLTETRYELLRMMRNPALRSRCWSLPLALYALFALVIAGEAINKDPNARHLPVRRPSR